VVGGPPVIGAPPVVGGPQPLPPRAPPRITNAGGQPAVAQARPLPANLGEPAPVRQEYQPKMPGLEKVSKGPSKSLWMLGGIGAGLAVVGIVGVIWWLLGANGSLVVTYEPSDALVLLDGAEVCTSSPCIVSKVPTGPHRLEIRKDQHESVAKVVEISRDDIYRVAPDPKLKPLINAIAVVIVSDPTDAEVKINGKVVKELGVAGMYSGELAVGETHEVAVSKPGYETWRKTYEPKATDKPMNEFAGPLKRVATKVTFTSTPSGAEVELDGTKVGTTPVTVDTVDSSAIHSVVLRKRCFQDVTHTIVANSGDHTVDRKFTKKAPCN